MGIRVTGMYSGLDTESIISELVSAQSVKKSSLVKKQTKLSWKQDAWKALNTKIYDFYTNTLSNMRYQSSYMKKTTKVSNTNAIKVITGDKAVDGVRTVRVNELAKGAYLTGNSLTTKSGVMFSGAADLATIMKQTQKSWSAEEKNSISGGLTGSFRVVGTEGAYVDFEVNEKTTINDVVNMIQSTGLNANFDQENQRIFISSKNTGAVNNFNIVANDEGGLNALAFLGLLSQEDLACEENKTWAAYADDPDAYNKRLSEEIKARQQEYVNANKKLAETNEKLNKENTTLTGNNKKLFDAMDDSDYLSTKFAEKYPGESLKDIANSLYGDDGLYDQLYKDGGLSDKLNAAKAKLDEANAKLDEANASETMTDDKKAAVQAEYDSVKADYDGAKADYDSAKKEYDENKKKVNDFLDDICYGEYVEKKDEEGNVVTEKVQKLDEDGKPVEDEDGEPVYEDKPVMVREGGLNKLWKDSKDGKNASDELKAQVDSLNKWYGAVNTLEDNKKTITSNNSKIESNEAKIADNEKYMTASIVSEDDVDSMAAMSALEADVKAEVDAKIYASQKAVEAAEGNGAYANMINATKVDAQDAEILINGAKFTSMTNTFSVNGLTLTALEKTDKDVTMTTSTDTDGIYDMIKNFFSEYNKLINEMDSLYNADSSAGYEPLTSEEKDALSDTEVEEWEKKIKDSLLRKDATLSSISFSMLSVFLGGATVNGKQMYLSDFGINTLGYFNAKDNERNAYHIDGDPDDADTKANDDVLKSMIASDPDTVMDFFTQLSTKMYDTLTSKMSSTDMSSAFTVYNDKQMKEEYNDYTSKITKEEEKLNSMMDKWYKKFSAMEVALSKLESRSSSLASILGN